MDTLEQILKSFGQTFDQYIEQKPVYSKGSKSGTVEYIPWFNLCDILDTYAPCWEWELSCDYHGDRTVVIGKLTIHGSDRSISRSATGNEDSNCGSFGDPCSNAEAMAMRRCCAKFGIARYLWAKDDKPKSNQSWAENVREVQTRNQQPKPKGKGTISREEWLARQRPEGIDTMIHQTILDEQPRSDMFGD
jgi:hypothetical protein